MEYSKCRREPRTRPEFRYSLSRSTLQDFPASLPTELWRKIISFTIRSSLGSRTDLEDAFEFSSEEADENADADLLSDRKSLARVSFGWRSVVAEISAECLTIRNGKTLASTVQAFEHSKTEKSCAGPRLGEMTRRIDVRECSNWHHDNTYNAQLVRLLKCTPNLQIYIHNDFRMIPEPAVVAREVLETLVMHCGRSLQHIRWKTVGKMLDHLNTKECNVSPDLVTLNLASMHSVPDPDERGSAGLLCLPRLKTLSLSSIPSHTSTTATPWDYFVQRMSLDSKQLPSLERFDCDRFPLNAMSFFHVHGHKILQLQASQYLGNNISGAIEMCPRLESFIINECRADSNFPSAHPTLKRICIRSNGAWIPFESLDYLVRSIENMDAPRLKTVQLNTGALCGIIDSRLHSWWDRLGVRGVRLVNEMGASYENVYKPIQNFHIDYESDFNDYFFH